MFTPAQLLHSKLFEKASYFCLQNIDVSKLEYTYERIFMEQKIGIENATQFTRQAMKQAPYKNNVASKST